MQRSTKLSLAAGVAPCLSEDQQRNERNCQNRKEKLVTVPNGMKIEYKARNDKDL